MSKILIVDDHPLMRKGLALSLNAEPDLTVCGQAANAEEALSALEELDPDLAIVDISLPGMGGLELIKLEAGEMIVKAVRRVLGGGIYVSEEINERLLLALAAGRPKMAESPVEVLSDRELEVFELTGRGLGTRVIAERLYLSVKTVESYRARIKDKLNLKTAAELMQHAVQWVEGEGAR